ncbi:unnamed protein product [Allacma fusca]|uniref:Peptidase M12A domain-containing protein n=1 Tax=Allacma fusca TaxID=39272 RepID=A0A8J2NUJ5_9HEXA|nr:unnamed protein product [Allacma fusca]
MHILALWLVLILVLPSNARTRVRRSAPEEMAGLFEGDIVISEKEKELLEDGKASAGIIGSHFRWPQATVPYTISNDFSRSDVQTMQAAMSEISAKTCIRFKPHGGERHSIFIQDGYGCSSEVGRREPMQEVTLSRGGCITKGTVIHELVHAIGFWHEQ